MLELHYVIIAALLASIAFGVIGTFVVTRRISSIAGAIAHSVLGGIGAALYFKVEYGLAWCHPMLGAIIAAIIAALVIGFVSIYAKQREDTIIGAIWAIGMAIGLLFIANTPGEFHLEDYLFGNIQLISQNDIYLILILDIVIILPAILLFNNILGVCFDSHFSELCGVRVKLIYFMLLIMTALTIVLMVIYRWNNHGHRDADAPGGGCGAIHKTTLVNDAVLCLVELSFYKFRIDSE